MTKEADKAYLNRMWDSGKTLIFSPYRRFGGATIPNWILRREAISYGAKVVYGRLAQFAGKTQQVSVKQRHIASEIGCGVRQLTRYLDELVELGLIAKKKEARDGASCCYYFLLSREIYENVVSNAGNILDWVSDFSPRKAYSEAPSAPGVCASTDNSSWCVQGRS